MNRFDVILSLVSAGEKCVLVTVGAVSGSTPREQGAWMVVSGESAQTGTVGGGALEWQAAIRARQVLADNDRYAKTVSDQILGPDLNQCCGGRVELVFEVFTASERKELAVLATTTGTKNQTPLYIFGAGHVGKALARACVPLDFAITLVDPRPQMFACDLDATIMQTVTSEPQGQIKSLSAPSLVIIMTHSHDLDYAICKQALASSSVAFTGLIGSKTKRARFVKRLAHDGLTQAQIAAVECPVGYGTVRSKKPAAIAASIAVRLLEQTELVKTSQNRVRFIPKSA